MQSIESRNECINANPVGLDSYELFTMIGIKHCPCNSRRPYADCCEPILSGRCVALTAEALMRSRYVAFVLHDVKYLLATWHPSARPISLDPATFPEWKGLQIIRTEKGAEADTEGVVEFRATALAQKQFCHFHEVSRFVKEEGQWFYTDGDVKDDVKSSERRVQKVGRNDDCPCGSGKKYKKCCSL